MSKGSQEFEVEVINHRGRIDARWVGALCKKILTSEAARAARVNIVVTDNRYIRQLNRDYRGQNRVTDVLAFNLHDRDLPGGVSLLGEIYISWEKARAQARARRHSFREEVRKLVVHGLLHLLGYDHRDGKTQKAMEKKEGVYLSGRKVMTP